MASLRTQRGRLSHFHPQLPSLTLTSRLQHPLHNQLHLRYASHSGKSHARPSSSAQPTEKRVPSVTSTSTNPAADDINPPPSTRPATLDLPDSLPSDAAAALKIKRYVALGRAFLSFYKTGLKNVYHNYRTSLPIRRSLGIPSYLPTSPPPHLFLSKANNSNKSQKLKHDELRATRSTFQLLNRAAYDVRRMIPFTLILILCGELTPLAVLFFGNAVTPYTCRVPKQIEKYRDQRINAKRSALSAHSAAENGSITPAGTGSDKELEILSRFAEQGWVDNKASETEILRACAVFGLAKTHARPGVLVGLLYRRRLRAYAEYLGLDDRLIRKCGGVSAMEGVEVRVAVEERAGHGVALGKEGWEAERVERRWLEKWLERRSE